MYNTLFTISWPGEEFILLLMWSVGISFSAVIVTYFNKNRKGSFIKLSPKVSNIVHFTICGLIILAVIAMFGSYLFNSYRLASAYKEGQYEIVEGEVFVLHEQPATGHDVGDRILIGKTKLIVDYSKTTNAYQRTIAHGGVLKHGVYARIYHYKGKILRIDIRE